MADQVYLGVDLGAESGRVMAGMWDGATIRLEEIHRFPNGGVWVGESLRWDAVRLWGEIQNGLSLAAKRYGRSVVSVGVDTWGVDFVLLSKSDELLGLPYQYRDSRTRGLLKQTVDRLTRERIFASTGLQFMEINTLFQLIAYHQRNPELLANATSLLMMPDFFHWALSGERRAEFTNATTTQFFDPVRRAWATDLLSELGLPTHLLPPVVDPGTRLGTLRTSLAERIGLPPGQVSVIAPATHDTGSAVAAVPTSETGSSKWAYISSGTWSLMGVEIPKAILTPKALALNMTNEGGVDGTYRLLKNIMGLWLVQQLRRAMEAKGKHYSYDELVMFAEKAEPHRSLVDPDHVSFLSPVDMIEAIQGFCRATNQRVPSTEGELVRCALESLALKYRTTLESIEVLTGVRVEVIHIMGGGSRNAVLNQFTADACQRPVLAGPVEATVLGNVLMQVRSSGGLKSLRELREVVSRSSELKCFDPSESQPWDAAAAKFASLCGRE